LVEAKFSALKESKPHEYLVRFIFGGAATVAAGLIANHFGARAGGLFLAFPAIFPASATLIEAHEKKRMRKIGRDGTNRGRLAARIDAAGSALGCVGLAGFALTLWLLLPAHGALWVMIGALAIWMTISVVLWEIRKNRIFGVRSRLLK
jgi:hypothetical protein